MNASQLLQLTQIIFVVLIFIQMHVGKRIRKLAGRFKRFQELFQVALINLSCTMRRDANLVLLERQDLPVVGTYSKKSVQKKVNQVYMVLQIYQNAKDQPRINAQVQFQIISEIPAASLIPTVKKEIMQFVGSCKQKIQQYLLAIKVFKLPAQLRLLELKAKLAAGMDILVLKNWKLKSQSVVQ